MHGGIAAVGADGSDGGRRRFYDYVRVVRVCVCASVRVCDSIQLNRHVACRAASLRAGCVCVCLGRVLE